MKHLAAFVLLCCTILLGCKSRPPIPPPSFASIQLEPEPSPVTRANPEPQSSPTPQSRSSSDPATDQPPARRTRLVPAPPMPPQSLGLCLQAEPRKGKPGEPYRVLCNVRLHILNNSSIPIWILPKVTFYAEQAGDFYPLRVIEGPADGIYMPYSQSAPSVTLPRPPHPGTWNIFAIQEHSDTLYQRRLSNHTANLPRIDAEDQDLSCPGIWTNRLVSNLFTVEFGKISPAETIEAEAVIQGLSDAGQYKPEFRQPQDDPTKPWTE